MQINTTRSTQKVTPVFTHEGAPAANINALQGLRRSLLACMLWEDQFYESGQSIAARIAALVPQVDATECMALAVEARHNMKLRHAPLLIAAVMAKLPDHKKLVAHTLEAVIDRADELTEFVAIYAKLNKVEPTAVKKRLSAQVKKGLARAFVKFNAYDFAKYNRDNAVKLRDVAFLSHVKAGENKVLGKTVAQLVNKVRYPDETKSGFKVKRKYGLKDYEPLATPDTWEVQISAVGAKAETEAHKAELKLAEWTRLLVENKLGALALLRNLRNMSKAGVDPVLVKEALETKNMERVLPFRFIAAARAVPQWEHYIEPAMLRCLEGHLKLPGKTVFLVDVSGSMKDAISGKSDLRRVDAAAALCILGRELCEDVEIYKFNEGIEPVVPRRGFALRDAIGDADGGTNIGMAVNHANARPYTRVICITDEQSHDAVGPPKYGHGYMINVAAYQHGVGYGKWNHIDGWSEAVFDYIVALEQFK